MTMIIHRSKKLRFELAGLIATSVNTENQVIIIMLLTFTKVGSSFIPNNSLYSSFVPLADCFTCLLETWESDSQGLCCSTQTTSPGYGTVYGCNR